MTFGEKPLVLFANDKIERGDWLWAKGVPGMESEQPEPVWWEKLSEIVEEDASRWEVVCDAMSKFRCRMDVRGKRGAIWTTVAAEET